MHFSVRTLFQSDRVLNIFIFVYYKYYSIQILHFQFFYDSNGHSGYTLSMVVDRTTYKITNASVIKRQGGGVDI